METIRNRGDGHVAHKGRGIFLVYVDIEAKDAKEFNEWYNTEHLPELLAVPGILAAARYEAVKGGPKYLAFYELDNVEMLRTPAFTNRPRTPWGQQVSPSVIGTNLTRIVGEQIYPDRIEMPERGMAPVLQIGRMSVPAEVEAEWNAWDNGAYIPGYRSGWPLPPAWARPCSSSSTVCTCYLGTQEILELHKDSCKSGHRTQTEQRWSRKPGSRI